MVMEVQIPYFQVLLTLLIILMLLMLMKRSSTSKKLPPGPWKLPVIGNLHNLMSSDLLHRKLRVLSDKYGPLMYLQIGEVPTIVVSSAEAAKEVLKTHDAIFVQRPFLRAIDVLAYGDRVLSFAPYGDYWRQLRKIMVTELLTTKRVQSFRSVREEEVSNVIRSISSQSEAGSIVNLSKYIFALTFSVVSRVAFGNKYRDEQEFIHVISEVSELAGGDTLADVFPSFGFLLSVTGMRSKLEKVHKKVDRILDEIVDERASSQKIAGESEIGQDMVQVLLNLQKHGDLQFPITKDHIKAVILDIYVAGSETSSTAIEWAMSLLLKYPQVMKRAQAEVRNVFGRQGIVDETRLQQLKYLKAVIEESMRLHPPGVILLPRECTERCEIFGYEIPIKTQVIVNAWAIARDPNTWSQADKFYPERFLDNPVDYKGTDYRFIPFGAGRRICPGVQFGMANIELPLAQLLYHFDWKLPNGANLEDLDMSESFGSTVRRRNDLNLIAIPYHPLPLE